NDHHISVGERVVTSGKDGIFPRGLVVGVVSDVVKTRGNLFQKIEVTPSVNFSMLETVMVITGERGGEHDGKDAYDQSYDCFAAAALWAERNFLAGCHRSSINPRNLFSGFLYHSCPLCSIFPRVYSGSIAGLYAGIGI